MPKPYRQTIVLLTVLVLVTAPTVQAQSPVVAGDAGDPCPQGIEVGTQDGHMRTEGVDQVFPLGGGAIRENDKLQVFDGFQVDRIA